MAGPIFASINISNKKTDDASGGVQQMTTSQQFEEAYIQLETIREIKVEKNSNEYKFSIKCLLVNFQANNSTLRARYWKMFKKDTYEFEQSRNWC